LHGAPGTGKTLFARAVAGEVNCSFISVTVQILAQNGRSRDRKVQALFEIAQENAPALSLLMKSMRWLQKDRRMMTECLVMT